MGRIIGDTFSILFRKLPLILLLGFVPAIVEGALGYAFSGMTSSQIGVGVRINLGGTNILDLASIVIASIVAAAIVQLAYDAKLNRPAQPGRYIAAVIKNLPAIVVLSIVVTVLCALAAILLAIPGLWLFSMLVPAIVSLLGLIPLILPAIWLYAVFSVFVPAIVIERAGFRALGRSAELTKNYRWPIVGALILVGLCLLLFAIVVSTVILLAFGMGTGRAPYLLVILSAFSSALGYGILSITVALIFARLKEIKEGISVADLVEVFK